MRRPLACAPATIADAAGKVAGVSPTDDGQTRFNNLVHSSYGAGSGAVRGLIGLVGLRWPIATLVHFATVWGA